MFKKELKSTTLIKAFLYRTKDGKNYLISTGRLIGKRIGSAIHECSNLGKVENWGNELFYNQSTNHEEAWKLFEENILNSQENNLK
jgi:hypothetical protein